MASPKVYLYILFSSCHSFFSSDLTGVLGQWSDHSWLLFIHQWPVHIPGSSEEAVRASHRPAVWDLLRLQPLHDLCGLPGNSGWPTRKMWVGGSVLESSDDLTKLFIFVNKFKFEPFWSIKSIILYLVSLFATQYAAPCMSWWLACQSQTCHTISTQTSVLPWCCSASSSSCRCPFPKRSAFRNT